MRDPSTVDRPEVDLGFRGLRCAVGDHIAYFWETPEEFEEAVRFLETGLERGEHVVVFGHESANAQVLDVIDPDGSRRAELEREGRISVLGPESSGEIMLSRIGATFQRAIDAGASMIRLLGNIGWRHEGWPDDEDILRFEGKVTEAAKEFPCVVVCMYDVDSLSGWSVLHGAFGTHPLTIYRNLIRENPMCEGVQTLADRDPG